MGTKDIQIPFWAQDSELKGWEYTIPEGMEAIIKDGKVIVLEMESEDERIRKAIEGTIRVYGKTQGEWIDGYDMDTPVVHLRQSFDALERQKDSKVVKFDHDREQKPVEWSEEDEKKIRFLSRLIEFQVKDGEYCFGEGSRAISKQEAISMLKSLRPQHHWKPSEEQMEALERASTNEYLSVRQYDILVSLYEQLTTL